MRFSSSRSPSRPTVPLVYRIAGGGPLRMRQFHDAQSTAIAGTEDASTPFFSPDGRWLGFFVGQALKKVSVTGSAVVTIATLPRYVGAQGYRGAAWSDDGMIAFAPSTGAGLFGVSDRGGEAKPLTVIDARANEAAHRWPHFLPGGKAILFTVKSTNLQSFDDAQIVVRSLETGEQHAVAQGHSAQYVPTGHLVFARAGALYADAVRHRPTRCHWRAGQGCRRSHHHPESGGAQIAISRNGALVYAAGGSGPPSNRPMGRPQRRCATSHRSTRIVLVAAHLSRRTANHGRHRRSVLEGLGPRRRARHAARVSQLAGDQDRAVWMPDGVQVTFGADTTGSGAVRMFSHRFDGTGSATLVFDSSESPSPLGWSPDGRKLLYRQIGAAHRPGRVARRC